MFCSSCRKFCGSQQNFCGSCGKSITNLPNNSSTNTNTTSSAFNSASSVPKTMSYADYYQSKSTDRTSRFQPKKKSKKVEIEDVTISISVLRMADDRQLRQMAGSRIPLEAKTTWTQFELKRAAYDKLSRYNSLIAGKNYEDVFLVYRSGERVRHLPGTAIPFTLGAYKNDIGMKYNSIVLYLQPYHNFSSDEEGDKEADDDALPTANVFSNSNAFKVNTNLTQNVDKGSSSSSTSSRSVLKSANNTTNMMQTSGGSSSISINTENGRSFDSMAQNIGSASSSGRTMDNVSTTNTTNMKQTNESASTEYGRIFQESKICSKCSRTITAGVPCLVCQQDKDYEESLNVDSEIAEPSGIDYWSSTSIFDNEQLQIPYDEIRLRRVAALTGSNISSNTVATLVPGRIEFPLDTSPIRTDTSPIRNNISSNTVATLVPGSIELPPDTAVVGTDSPICTDTSPIGNNISSNVVASLVPGSIELPPDTAVVGTDSPIGTDTSPIELEDDDTSLGEVTLIKHATIHRSRLTEEMFLLFSEPGILDFDVNVSVIDVRGITEQGVGNGVLRDLICSFFSEVSFSYMIGCQEKVPAVRHDMGENQWKAFARIIAYGLRLNYFPLFLSPVFLLSCLFGDSSITNDMLLRSFKQYIGSEERDLINELLTDFKKDDALLEFLDAYNCHRVPTKDNFIELILELAHQELVQKPKYITSCFADILTKNCDQLFSNVAKVINFYKEKDPSPGKVVKILSTPQNQSDKQRKVLSFLAKFIKALDKKDLQLFLRFVVGTDNMPPEINVVFCNQRLNCRSPRARVCINQLELEDSYNYYNELAEEFHSLLRDPNSFRFSFI